MCAFNSFKMIHFTKLMTRGNLIFAVRFQVEEKIRRLEEEVEFLNFVK